MMMPDCACGASGWVCENHGDVEWGKCTCGGAGSPCICNPDADMPPGTQIIAQLDPE
jgi:hypothetical protein